MILLGRGRWLDCVERLGPTLQLNGNCLILYLTCRRITTHLNAVQQQLLLLLLLAADMNHARLWLLVCYDR